jgi:ribose/xylose/arabinose/galactoside ABC-type transport system permease subunit
MLLDRQHLASHLLHIDVMDMQRFLIGLGLLVLFAGLAWPWLGRIGLGRLPGDILIQRGGTTFYFPLVTCLVISIVLSGLFWLFNR